MEQKDVPIYSEWIGTLDGFVNADIKAQVSGYLLKQDYTEGSFVNKGQLLFRNRSAAVSGRGGPGRGPTGASQRTIGAGQGATHAGRSPACRAGGQSGPNPAGRRPLCAAGEAAGHHPAGSGQRHAEQRGGEGPGAGREGADGTARAQIQAANAAVQAVTATVETAKLNLSFTRLTSPIDGLAGIAQQQVGALVSPASGPVTTVSTVDPIKVYFTASEQEYLDFHRRYPTAGTLDAARKGWCWSSSWRTAAFIRTRGASISRIGKSVRAPAPFASRVCSRIQEPAAPRTIRPRAHVAPDQGGRLADSAAGGNGDAGHLSGCRRGRSNKIGIRNVKTSDRVGSTGSSTRD